MADLRPFPLRRYVGKARHVAALIASKRGRDRDTYYRTTCKRLADVLRRIGFSERDVNEQIAAFTATVNECIAEGWHYPSRRVADDELADAHRLLDQGMSEIVQQEIDPHHGPGAA